MEIVHTIWRCDKENEKEPEEERREILHCSREEDIKEGYAENSIPLVERMNSGCDPVFRNSRTCGNKNPEKQFFG